MLTGFAILAIVWALLPDQVVFKSNPVCLHYKLFGLQCPFCGLSRAGFCMLHLRLADAWNYNTLIFYIGWLYLVEWTTLLNLRYVPKVRKLSWRIALGLIVVLYVLRLTH